MRLYQPHLDTGPGRSARSHQQPQQYWQEQLAGSVPILQLPLDRPRPAKPNYEAAVVYAALGVDLWQQTAAAAAAAVGVSQEAFVTAAVQVVLLRYSGQDEVTVGVPMAGTPGALPVKVMPAEGVTFADLARQAAEALAGARAHSMVSLAEIVTAAGLSAEQKVHPIFQVACQLFDTACPLESTGAASDGPKVDISIKLNSAGSLQLEYMVELFDPPTVQRLADSLATVLRHATLHPGTAIAALPLLSSAAAEQLLAGFALREFRPHYLSGPLTHELFEAAAAASPNSPCLVYEGTTLTYGEVNRRANLLAHALMRGGAQADRPVALLLDRSPEYMVALLATLKAGSCFVPLDPSYPLDRLANCMEDAAPVLLLSQARHAELARSLRSSCPNTLEVLLLDRFWDQPAANKATTANPGLHVDPSSLAYILFTSGSTGRPKGVMIQHRGIVDFLRGIADDLHLTPNDVGLLSITAGFDAHIYQALPVLVSGGSLVIAKPDGHTDPHYMASLIRQQSISWFMMVPTLASLYIEAMGHKPCTAVRAILLGGESLPRKMIAAVRNFLPEACLYNAYGPTEASVAISWQRVDHLSESEPITIGRPDPNAHCYIVTPQQQKGPLLVEGAAGMMPVGAPGELLISGPRLARGYAQRPDLTAAAFVPNPCFALVEASLPEELRQSHRTAYRTGDLVRWRPDGTIEYLGRIDQQVKIDGVRMEIDEIEAVLAAAPGVSHAAVVARVCPSSGRKRLVGYVVPATADLEAARAHCRSKLTSAMVPSALMALASLPLLANGKVDKKSLPEAPEPKARPGNEEYEGPGDAVEAAIQRIWQTVLGLPALPSVTADFFSLGGTSLKAGMIQARMQRQLGCASLPGSLVLQQRTIRAVAAAIAAAGMEGVGSSGGVAAGLAAGVIPCRHWSTQLRPLSANQQQMWLLHSMGLAAAYNMQASCRLQGQLDLGALQTALQGVVERHEVLRLQLVEGEEGQAVGKLLPAEALSVPLKAVVCPEGSAAVQAALEADMAQPFDLACPPCMRVLLLRHDAESCTMSVTMHHAAGDAWSYGVLQQDLSALYNAALQGQAQQLDPLPIQYSDYAAWQAQQLAGNGSLEVQRQRDYWRQQLAGCAPVLQLPLDRPRPVELTYAAGILQESLGKELMQQIAESARALRVSVQAVVLAAVQLLLLRYSGQDEVTVGVPTAGRQQPETHPLIGYCVNPLPIRAVPAEGATFADLARQAAETLVTALSNSLLPLAEVVEASGVPRQPGVNPLFQVMTQVLDEGVLLPSFSGMHASTLPSDAEPRVSQVKMDLYIQLDSGGSLRLEYMAELFDPATMEGVAASLTTLLRHVVAAPDTPIATMPLLSPTGAQQLLTSFACRELRPHYLSGPITHELFEAAAAANPGAPCLVYEGKALSYGEVNKQANQLAYALIKGGAQAERPIGLLLDRSPEYIVALLATFKAGSCFVPLDPSYPPDRLANCMEDAEPVLLLSMARHAELARILSTTCPSTPKVLLLNGFWDESATASLNAANPRLRVDPSSLAYILFTSGSTGRPKGVMIHHLGLADFLRGLVEDLELTPNDVGLFSITIAFDAHCYQTMPMLVSGGCLVIAKPEGHTDPPYMAALIRQQRVSFMIAVPTLAALYLEALRPQPCKTLRAIAMGGEALPRKMIGAVQEYLPHARLINAYGPTEATVAISWQRVERLRESEPITIGRPDPNAHCYIVTPQQQKGRLTVEGIACLAPTGAPGELLISGPRLARGYAKRPDQTAAAFVPNPCYSQVEASLPEGLRQYYRTAYRTGDLVRWRPDGTIEYLGRIDQQVKIDGVRMEIDEIEAVLAAAPGVSRAAVAAQVAPLTGRKRLVGYVVPATADLDAARAHCRSKLTPAMVPSVLLALDSLPLLANGKVDKKALPLPPEPEAGVGAGKGSEGYVAPANEVEEALQEIWQDALNLPKPPSVTADFFSLGGSSLKAGMIQARIREGLRVAGLGGMAVMQHPTIRALATHVVALAAAAEPADQGGQGSSFLAKHFSRHWQAGYGDATQKLLAGIRTFRSQRLLRLLAAEDPRLGQRLRGLTWPQRRLPYAVYLVLQYLLLVAAATPEVVAWIGQLLLLTTAYHYGVATGWLTLLWVPVCGVGALVVAALTVLLTWLLLPRGLRPGPHPLWGWLHCRWAAVRAVQRASLSATSPFFTRTPLLSWAFCLLGAHIGQGALLDTARLQDPQLVSIGQCSVLGTDVAAAGVTVAPAGALGSNNEPVMLVSEVQVGDECEVGHKAVLPAGARLKSGMHLKPRAAPSHPGAVGTGPLDGTPEFMAEARLGPFLSTVVALLYYTLHAFILLPGLAAVIAIMAPILGENPFNALDQRLFDTWQLDGHGPIPWRLVVWPPLFLALNMTVGQPTSATVHTLALLAFKKLVLGALPPGTNLTKSRWLLLRFAFYRRMLEDPIHQQFRAIFGGTTFLGTVYRWLGASVGKYVFLGGLTTACPDCLSLGDMVSSGGDSTVYGISRDGIVGRVVVEQGATIGNACVLYPGSRMQPHSLVGNDTVLTAGEVLPARVRKQGAVQYTVQETRGGDPEKGQGPETALSKADSAGSSTVESLDKLGESGAAPASGTPGSLMPPAWHTAAYAAASLVLLPSVPVLRWAPFSFAFVLVGTVASGWAAAVYVVGIGGALALGTAWLRLLPHLVRMTRWWQAGRASVFSIAAGTCHGLLSNPMYDLLLETPFMGWAYRALGFQVGRGAVLMGYLPLERYQVSIGAGAVVEGQAFVEGHYLEALAFTYSTCSVGERAWVQQGARVMPGVAVGAAARLLPGCTVLPGEVLGEGTLWGGGVPASPQGRAIPSNAKATVTKGVE